MLGNGIYVSTNIISELLMRFNGLFHVLQRGKMSHPCRAVNLADKKENTEEIGHAC
jgi:hypothetical protein